MNHTNSKIITLIVVLILLSGYCAFAQPSLQWVASYNGTANSLDYGRALRIDAAGNAYLCGTVTNSGSGQDIAVVKYNSAGVQKWVGIYNGTANGADWGYGLVIDSSGNTYATGTTSTATSGKDYVTVKFNSSGALQWAMQYNGSGNLDDAASHITLDPLGNVIVTGISKGSTTSDDYATVKYSPSGTQLWVRRYDGPASGVDDARTITSDKSGNVYVSGGSTGIGSDYDFATVKYNSAGTQQWVARYNGPLNNYDLVFYQGSVVVDSLYNVYITGYSKGLDSTLDYATVKYDSSGSQLWVSRFSSQPNGTDYADGLTIDDSLNVYVTGASFISGNNFDFATIKYNSQGIQQWVSYYNGTGNDWDEAYGVITDDSLNVYILGRSPGTTTSADFVTIKYSPQGNQIWEIRNAQNGYDWAFNIRFSNDRCIYVGGSFGTTISDMGVIKYCQTPVGINEPNNEGNSLFHIYPNPGNGKFTVMVGEARHSQIIIYNTLGEEVFQSLMTNDLMTFDLSSQPKGIYFIQINSEKESSTKKIIIQ